LETGTSNEIFDHLQPAWNRLLSQSASDTPFLTWEFQKTWWESFGQGRALRVITARQSGDLIGIAPLYVETLPDGQQTLRLIGGLEVADYLDAIIPAGQERVVLPTLLDYLWDDAAYAWDLLDLHNVPATSPTREVFRSWAAQRGRRIDERVEEVCPILQLPSTWDAYLQSLDSKQRHEIRRKMRKIQTEAETRWHIVQEATALPQAVTDLIELHQKSRADKGEFMSEAMQDFFRALAHAAFATGWLQLSFLEINGQRAATLLCFDYRDSVLVYNSGFDPRAYSGLSPGVVLTAHCIENAIRLGRTKFDFLQGAEEYKYRFGAQDTYVYQLTLHR